MLCRVDLRDHGSRLPKVRGWSLSTLFPGTEGRSKLLRLGLGSCSRGCYEQEGGLYSIKACRAKCPRKVASANSKSSSTALTLNLRLAHYQPIRRYEYKVIFIFEPAGRAAFFSCLLLSELLYSHRAYFFANRPQMPSESPTLANTNSTPWVPLSFAALVSYNLHRPDYRFRRREMQTGTDNSLARLVQSFYSNPSRFSGSFGLVIFMRIKASIKFPFRLRLFEVIIDSSV